MKILPHHPDDKPQLCHWLPNLPCCCYAILILNDILTIKKRNDDENNFKAWAFVEKPVRQLFTIWRLLLRQESSSSSATLPSLISRKVYSGLFSLWCVTAAFRERGRFQVGLAQPGVIPEEASPSSQRCGWARAWVGGWAGPLTATPPCRPAPRRSRSPSRGSEEVSTGGGRVSSEHQTCNLGLRGKRTNHCPTTMP